jgi:hypothetical protein
MDFSTAGRLLNFLNTTGDVRCGRFQAHGRRAFVQVARLLLALNCRGGERMSRQLLGVKHRSNIRSVIEQRQL